MEKPIEYKSINEHENEEMLIKNLRSIPTQIAELEEKLREKHRKKEEITVRMQTIATNIASSVLAEQDGNGNPKYTNEMQRKQAIIQAQHTDKSLDSQIQNQNKNTEETEELLINIRFFHNTIKVEGIIAQMRN